MAHQRPTYPAFRSASLPNPTEHNKVRPHIQMSFVNHPTPQFSRRDSAFMASEGPITPPLSPTNSEGDDSAIIVDSEPRYSGGEAGGHRFHDDQRVLQSLPQRGSHIQVEASSRRPSRTEAVQMDVDVHHAEVPRLPMRHLEDEKSHVHRGSLKLTDFEVKGTLGTGTFGRVLLVRLRSSSSGTTSMQNCYALKVLRKSEIVRLRQVEHVNAERYILSRVQHPFIVDLFATFQDSLNIYMLLSYIPGGELFTHLRRAQRFTPDVTRFYLATIILALKYLHSFNIIYRDLKPENLLLDSRGYLRLTDFGFAKIVDDRTWTLCGTPEYLAPEIIQSDGHGKAADWWACGILAYEMMVGYPPFFDETPYGIYEKILKGKIYWPKDMDRLSKDLIKAFLHPDRSKRLGNLIGGAQDVLDHPWFRGVDWDALERREIRAPIIPHVASMDDTRHFSRLPLPPAEEIPGLIREEQPPALQQQFDPSNYHFLEF
ncbi:cAMP dependent protein kinase [Panus rudis PR-1116 ss-1]|nr:cAMP dependent protein kinase [Panus rudis PR-1116 ss-1]